MVIVMGMEMAHACVILQHHVILTHATGYINVETANPLMLLKYTTRVNAIYIYLFKLLKSSNQTT